MHKNVIRSSLYISYSSNLHHNYVDASPKPVWQDNLTAVIVVSCTPLTESETKMRKPVNIPTKISPSQRQLSIP
jgi:hypothetical protein